MQINSPICQTSYRKHIKRLLKCGESRTLMPIGGELNFGFAIETVRQILKKLTTELPHGLEILFPEIPK